MPSKPNLSIIFACLLSSLIVASPIGYVSYIQDIQVSYENGKWFCDGIECPLKTHGCRIQRKTNFENGNKLDIVSTCFDEQKKKILSATTILDMFKAREIDIDIESYIGAESVYSCGYGLNGKEDAQGTISPNGWAEFKETADDNKKSIEIASASFNKLLIINPN